MTRARGPGIPPVHAPALPPPNPAATTSDEPFDLVLINSEADITTELKLVRLRDGKLDPGGIPQFTEGSAPAILDAFTTDSLHGNELEHVSYGTTPPDQGKTSLTIDFSHGLSTDKLGMYKRGQYAWGNKVWTLDTGGLMLRAPATATVAPVGSTAAAPDITTSLVNNAGSLVVGTEYKVSVSSVDANGRESAVDIGTPQTPIGVNTTIRITFGAATNAVSYRFYVSPQASPLFVAEVTEGQRQAGRIITGQGATAAGGAAGAVDVRVWGTGHAARGPSGTLDARVESKTTHNASSWFSAGSNVFYLDEVAGALVIKEPVSQPAGTFRITQIFSWQGILLVAHDTVDPYEWSDDDGATWHKAGIDQPYITIDAPGTLTTSIQNGGSLANDTYYNIAVTAQNAAGQESLVTAGTKVLASNPNKTARILFDAVPGATEYRIYVSSDASPLFTGHITEAQRLSGIKIVAPDTTGAGGVAGGVDVEVAGVGDSAPPDGRLSTAIVAGGSLVNGTTYRVKVAAVDQFGVESVAREGAPQAATVANKTLRVAFDAVDEAATYRIYLSDDLDPRFVGHVTEAERASGIKIVSQDTTGAGGTAGAVDIEVAGAASFTTPGAVTSSIVNGAGGTLVQGKLYQSQVVAVDSSGNGSVAVSGTARAPVSDNQSLRLAFAQVAAADGYLIFMSTDAVPKFAGYVSEKQRAAGARIGADFAVEAVAAPAIGTPGALTTSAQAGGSLITATTYNILVTAVSATGEEGLPMAAQQLITNPNLTARILFAAVPNAVAYRIYLSTDAVPKFVGTITESQRNLGIKIVAQDTVGAGVIAGGVDVEVAGTGVAGPVVGGHIDVQVEGTGGTYTVTNVAHATPVQRYAKFFASFEESEVANNPARPVIVMANDPNFVYETEDPTDASQWNAGSIVGQGGSYNPDHNTSLHVAPTGELLVGKALNMYQLDAAADATYQTAASVKGDVSLRMGPVSQSIDAGMENFAWPQNVGFSVYTVLKDFDIVRFRPQRMSSNFSGVLLIPETGFGPAFKLPATPEAQQAVTALATDNIRLLFAALAGSEGYVLVGVENDQGQGTGGFDWHGAIAATGWPVRFMWTESFPLSSDLKDMRLFIARNTSPFTIVSMRIPRTNAFYDSGVTFVSTGTVRFGRDYGGQAQVQKVLSRLTPNTRNLAVGGPTVELLYQTVDGAGFTSLATFTDSPLPTAANLPDSYVPSGVHGTFVEVEAIITGNTAIAAAIESIEVFQYRRPIRKALLNFTVFADTQGQTNSGGRRGASWHQLVREIRAARDAVQPPLLVDKLTGDTWTVDLQSFNRRWLLDHQGQGAAMVVDIVAQELDSRLAQAAAIRAATAPAVFHAHRMEQFGINGAVQFQLNFDPLDTPEVFADNVYQMEGVDYTWDLGTKLLVFPAAPAGITLTVFYIYQP